MGSIGNSDPTIVLTCYGDAHRRFEIGGYQLFAQFSGCDRTAEWNFHAHIPCGFPQTQHFLGRMKADFDLMSKLCTKGSIQVKGTFSLEIDCTFVFGCGYEPNKFVNVVLFHGYFSFCFI